MKSRVIKLALALVLLSAATAAHAQRGPGVSFTGQIGPTVPFLCQTDEGYGRKGSCDQGAN